MQTQGFLSDEELQAHRLEHHEVNRPSALLIGLNSEECELEPRKRKLSPHATEFVPTVVDGAESDEPMESPESVTAPRQPLQVSTAGLAKDEEDAVLPNAPCSPPSNRYSPTRPTIDTRPDSPNCLKADAIVTCSGRRRPIAPPSPGMQFRDTAEAFWRMTPGGTKFKVYYDCTTERGLRSESFVEGLSVLGSFDTKQQFEAQFGQKLHLLSPLATLRVFHAHVQPAWEDIANFGVGAGQYMLSEPSAKHANSVFLHLMEALTGGALGFANGLLRRKRFGTQVVCVWTASCQDANSEAQRAQLLAALPPYLQSSTKITFRAHRRACKENAKMSARSRHARTDSLEVHLGDLDELVGSEEEEGTRTPPLVNPLSEAKPALESPDTVFGLPFLTH